MPTSEAVPLPATPPASEPTPEEGTPHNGRRRDRGRHRGGGSADLHLFCPAHPRHVFVFRRAAVHNAADVRPDPRLGVSLICASFLADGKCSHGVGDDGGGCPRAHVDSLADASARHVPHVKSDVGAGSLDPETHPPERQPRYPTAATAAAGGAAQGPMIQATLPNSSRLAPPIRAEDCLLTRALDVSVPPPGVDGAVPAAPVAVAAGSVCAHFLLHDRCNLGRECRYLHVLADSAIHVTLAARTPGVTPRIARTPVPLVPLLPALRIIGSTPAPTPLAPAMATPPPPPPPATQSYTGPPSAGASGNLGSFSMSTPHARPLVVVGQTCPNSAPVAVAVFVTSGSTLPSPAAAAAQFPAVIRPTEQAPPLAGSPSMLVNPRFRHDPYAYAASRSSPAAEADGGNHPPYRGTAWQPGAYRSPARRSSLLNEQHCPRDF